jgi:hypothetical protein
MTTYNGKVKKFDGGLNLEDSSKKYIGIDQSYGGFGITVINTDGKFQTQVYKSVGSGVERLRDIALWLGEEVFEKTFNIQDAAMEGYAFGSQMANMLGELGGMVKMECRAWFYDSDAKYPLIVAPPMLKKFITGKGRVEKNQVLLHTFKKWSVEFPNDDAADSYALARIAAGMGNLAYEKDILEKLLDPKYREKP